MQCLVTGANGFVGSHVVDELLRRGHAVRCVVRRGSDLSFLPTEGIELHFARLVEDELGDEALGDVELVLHLAARLRAPDDDAYRALNVQAGLHLYESFARRSRRPRRFVFCSSQAAAGPSVHPRREDEPPQPISAYGRTKLEAERALVAADGPALTILRPCGVYGPRDRATLPLFKLARRGLGFCFGSSSRPLAAVHVEDVARAFADAAAQEGGDACYFVTDGATHTWGSLVDALSHAAGRRLRRITMPDGLVHASAVLLSGLARIGGGPSVLTREKARDFTARGWACSGEAAKKIGYFPQVELRAGMASTYQWYRNEGWL